MEPAMVQRGTFEVSQAAFSTDTQPPALKAFSNLTFSILEAILSCTLHSPRKLLISALMTTVVTVSPLS
jgi:hypothetical protein